MKILVFMSGLMGELTLKHLLSENCFPHIAAYSPEYLRRKTLAGDIFSFSDKFKTYKIKGANFSACSDCFSLYDCAVTVDWTKDFFHGSSVPFPVYHTHPSLLPMYRGYGAVSEQFIRGVKISGLTAYADDGVIDAGDIVFQEKIKIEYGDIPADFIEKCAESCAKFIVMLNKGYNFNPVPQNHNQGFYITRTRGRKTIIDFNACAFSVYNFITAYSYPFSGAIFYYKGRKCRAFLCSVEKWEGDYGEAGEIISKSYDGAEIACGSGTIILKQIYDNDRIIDGWDWEAEEGEMINR